MKKPIILSFLLAGLASASGERPFTALKLGQNRGIALDASGNLYVPDLESSKLHKVTPAGNVSVVPSAPIVHMHNITFAPDGQLYAVETEVSKVHRLDKKGATALAPAGRNDVFLGATTIVFDAAGNLYIGENDVNIVRKLTPAGEFSIHAGAFKEAGNQDGVGGEARFTRPRALAIDPVGNHSPRGLAADAGGNIYVTDTGNHAIRKVAPDGNVTTFAGKAGEAGFADGAGGDARFKGPRAAALDSAGNLFVADSDNGAVRMITADGNVRTVVAAAPLSAR